MNKQMQYPFLIILVTYLDLLSILPKTNPNKIVFFAAHIRTT